MRESFGDLLNDSQIDDDKSTPAPNIEPTPQEQMVQDTIEPEVLPSDLTKPDLQVPSIRESIPENLEVAPPVFDYKSIANPKADAYVPRGTWLPELKPEGSLWSANIAEGTSLGWFMNNRSQRDYKLVDRSKFNAFEYIPDDLKAYPGAFALDTSVEQVDETISVLRQEIANEEVMARHPWQSTAIGFATQLLDPINLLPMGKLYQNFKQASITTRAAIGAASANALTTTMQEALLHNSQLTRTSQESVWNVAASGILGGALGVGAGKLGETGITINRARALASETGPNPVNPGSYVKAHLDIVGVYEEVPIPLTDRGLLAGSELEYMPKWVQKAMIGTPLNRSKTGPFQTASLFSDIFIESNYNTVRNANYETLGNAVETQIRLFNSKMSSVLNDVRQQYYDMIGIKGNYFKETRSKFANAEMNYDTFLDRVSLAIYTKRTDPNPSINKAAEIWTKGLIEPTLKEAIDLGLLPEGVTPKTAAAYFTKVANKQKIIEQGGSTAWGPGTYPYAIYQNLKQTQEKIKKFVKSKKYLEKNGEIAELEKNNKAKNIDKEIKKQNKERIDELKKEIKEMGHPYMFNSKGELFDIVDDETLEAIARQVVDKELGQVGDKLLNPVYDKIAGNAKPLNERTLMVDQEALHEWHLRDPIAVGNLYIRAMGPILALTKKAHELGYADIKSMREDFGNALKTEYDDLAKGLSGKEAAKLEQQFRTAQKDMNSTLEILQGIYGQGDNVLSNKLAVFSRNFRTFTAIRFLGGMMISSFSDIGQNVFRNGPFQFIFHGLLPVLRSLDGIQKKDLRAIGRGMEVELGSSMRAFLDNEGLTTNPGIITKSFDYLSNAFSNATGMNPWNSMMQRLAGSVSMNRTLDTIAKVVEGKKVSAIDRKRVANLGIDEKYFDFIYSKTKDNIDPVSKSRYADWTEWQINDRFEAEALNQFQAGTLKDIDTAVIKPSLGDKPLFAHSQFGKYALQFKSFSLSATNKILYSGIQRRHDANMYMGVSMMLAMGAMSYTTMKLLRGEEPDLSFETLGAEALDRSGLLGIFGEVWNIGQKAGIIPGEGVSRYQSRGILGAFIGPSIGSAEELSQLLHKAQEVRRGEANFTTSDVQKSFRFAPYQNLFYLQYLNKLVVRKIGKAYGLKETRKEP